MEWYEQVTYPEHAIGDPRLRPRHHSLLLAVRYLAERKDAAVWFEATNWELQRLARIRDRDTFYRHRDDLDQLDYLTYLRWKGHLTEYDIPDRGQILIPAGVITDWRITTPGAITLYLALSTLAQGAGGYPIHCQVTNQQLMTAAGFSTPRQLNRYRNELVGIELLEITHTHNGPPTYLLPLNQGAQDKYLSVIAASA